MTMLLNSYVDQHKLIFKLQTIQVNELYLLPKLNNPAYLFKQGVFQVIIPSLTSPSKEQIQTLQKNGVTEIFVFEEDKIEIKSNLELTLTKLSRSLSIGDPIDNGSKEIKLLSRNMASLYDNPHNDELLKLQFQSSQNLSKFLIENKKHQNLLYEKAATDNQHFIISQPMMSSLMLLSFLQHIHLFNDKEIENLFLASYLKDLGVALIPKEKYNLKDLNENELDLFSHHADFSSELLQGRIPLTTNYLNIIKNHHFLNDKLKRMIGKNTHRESEMVLGLETTLVAVFDMLVAMTNDRPYRNKLSMYQALEVIKILMADNYPQEYKAIILFIRQFFKN
jgi:response regulator RpfG family c-di-GMP phosphodiesterase